MVETVVTMDVGGNFEQMDGNMGNMANRLCLHEDHLGILGPSKKLEKNTNKMHFD